MIRESTLAKINEPKRGPYLPELREPSGTYGLVAVCGAAVVSLCFIVKGWHWVGLVPLGLAIIGIIARLRFAGPVFLVFVLGLLAASETTLWHTDEWSGLTTWLISLALLVFLIAYNRFLSFMVRIFPQPRRRSILWAQLYLFWAEMEVTKPRRRSVSTCPPEEPWSVFIWAVACLAAAQILIAIVPAEWFARNLYNLDFEYMRAILLAWIAVLVLLGGRAIIGYWRWQNLSPHEAGVHIRSVLWTWNSREAEALEKYAWRRTRRQLNR